MSNFSTPTRDEAIRYLVGTITRFTVDAGAQLAQAVGPEIAADLTVSELDAQQLAFEALGVTEDDIRRVAGQLDAETAV